MTLRDATTLSSGNLVRNPVRTFLTMLGLGVGIGAILTVLALGSAGQAEVESEIARLGVDKVWITCNSDSDRPLQPEDSAVIARAVGAPACAGASTIGAVQLDETTCAASITGYDAGIELVHHPHLLEGRLFSYAEYTSAAAVAIIDQSLSDTLGGDMLGRRIWVSGRSMRVVGIVSDMLAQPLAATSGSVLLPLRTFLDTYSDVQVTELTFSVPRGMRADTLCSAAEDALSTLGGAYTVSSLQDEIDAARSVIRIFVMVLSCVAAVCMLTGSIGVMNILLVSVRERRREIGLLKAIGATRQQVALLFVLEGAGYALLGGLCGLVLGVVMIHLFGAWIGLKATLSPAVACPVLLAASALGLLFGVLPAMRAANLAPVEALRGS